MEFLIPILLGLGLFAALFGIRYLQNKENMLMIQNGMDPSVRRPKGQSFTTLKAGLLMIGSGLGLFLAFVLDNTVLNFNHGDLGNNDENAAIYFSLIAIFGGLGLFISHLIEKKANEEK
ncbi:hypothetical protein SAMN05421813_105138 [Daejeonella rubra]|uniref:DUF6249 domain-containing protein n=1 Tax=Daejeonella rubra TaxID=990371 RepID=A0A1G9Q819_9SPHI|nr:DUF6249 domain-containing protein [Daejeonella rubra]SDM06505.1 hypothetical protein SAMN05421813_105138 [Daejeonella rubra]